MSEEISGPPVVAKRLSGLGVFPPVTSFIRTPGTEGNYARTTGSVVPSKLFLPGELGPFTVRVWARRPSSPVASGGVLTDLRGTVAGQRIRVAIETSGEVTVSAAGASGTPVSATGAVVAFPVPGRWRPITITHEDGLVEVRVAAELVASLDVSGLTFDADPDLSGGEWSFGAAAGGASPLDVDALGPTVWDVALDEAQRAALDAEGPSFDPRNPTGSGSWNPFVPPDGEEAIGAGPPRVVEYDPVPAVVFVDPPTAGQVPDGQGSGALFAIIGETSITHEPSAFRAWFLSAHRIGIWSSAWFDDGSLDVAAWGFAFETAAHADVFGEVPRVFAVHRRGDGVMVLDIDAAAQPGVRYVLTGPADLAGDALP